MFTFMHNLWMTLQCPTPHQMLEEAYNLPHAEDSIAYLEKWTPYLCEHDLGELFGQMSYDLAFCFDNDTYSNKLFDWMEINSPFSC